MAGVLVLYFGANFSGQLQNPVEMLKNYVSVKIFF